VLEKVLESLISVGFDALSWFLCLLFCAIKLVSTCIVCFCFRPDAAERGESRTE